MQTDILIQTQSTTAKSVNGKKLPPLENGDRLTRDEFHRRYEAMPNVKAELIEGVVYMSSPVRVKNHGEPHSRMMWFLGSYCVATDVVNFADNSTVRLDADNEPQPDAILYVKEEFGGASYISLDDYLEGSPELVVEIAASTVSHDTSEKKKIYRRNNVKEYLVWRVYDAVIDWYVLENGEYLELQPDQQGVIESRFFAGLRLNVKAMLADDLKQVLSDLQKGLESKKHSTFVEKLEVAAKK